MPLSEAAIMLIINNASIIFGAAIKYIASSECVKLACCGGLVKAESISNPSAGAALMKEAENEIESVTGEHSIPIRHISLPPRQLTIPPSHRRDSN